jgi:hypothetical protein
MSCNHRTTRVVWIFHQVIPNLVLRTVGVMRLAHRAFKVFDHPYQDFAWFVELRIFPRCDQFLLPWSRGIELWLAWPDIWRPRSTRVARYRVLLNTRVSLRSSWAKCSLVTWHMAWLLNMRSREMLRFQMLNEPYVPPSLLLTKCPSCKML